MIETLEEYQAAMKELDWLWDRIPGSPEQDKRFVDLSRQLNEYEYLHMPIDPPSPEEAKKFRQEQDQGYREALALVQKREEERLLMGMKTWKLWLLWGWWIFTAVYAQWAWTVSSIAIVWALLICAAGAYSLALVAVYSYALWRRS